MERFFWRFLLLFWAIVIFVFAILLQDIGHNLDLSGWAWVWVIIVLLAMSGGFAVVLTAPLLIFYKPITDTQKYKEFGYLLKRGSMIAFYVSIAFIIALCNQKIYHGDGTSEKVFITEKVFTNTLKEGDWGEYTSIGFSANQIRFLITIGFISLLSSIIILVLSKIIIYKGIYDSKQN